MYFIDKTLTFNCQCNYSWTHKTTFQKKYLGNPLANKDLIGKLSDIWAMTETSCSVDGAFCNEKSKMFAEDNWCHWQHEV